MSNRNRKPTQAEKASAARVIREAYPDLEPIFGAHGDYGGHRAPRDHTMAFRLRDRHGKYRSNIIWLMPEQLSRLTVNAVKKMVDRSNG